MSVIRDRWDETWLRLRERTSGQAQSERLAAQILDFDGYTAIDPVHPLGGRDGGADILCKRDGLQCLAAVYFPMGLHGFREVKKKFLGDFQKAISQQPPIGRFVFITNQQISRPERKVLRDAAAVVEQGIEVQLYHIENITVILDSYRMRDARRRFLGIEDGPDSATSGRGGDAHAIGADSIAMGGHAGRSGEGPGGDGGHSVATGEGSVSIGGNGGDAARPGGIGGRGARGPTERITFPSNMWGRGRGGRGACAPEAFRVNQVLIGICREYSNKFDQDAPFIDSGLEQVPTDWLNVRLAELGEKWQVEGEESFRELRPLDR